MMQALVNSYAVILLIGTMISRLKRLHGSILSKILQAGWDELKATPLMAELLQRLWMPGIRSAWAEDVTVDIRKFLETDISFEKALIAGWSSSHSPLITSFAPPTSELSRFDETIRFAAREGKRSESGPVFPVLVPALVGSGLQPTITAIVIDAQWRTSEHVSGWLCLEEDTLDLIFMTTEGELHLSHQGQPFRIKRWKWLTSISFGCDRSIIKNHCILMGWWKELRPVEVREVAARTPGDRKKRFGTNHRTNTVHTLVRSEIDADISNGDVNLISLGGGYKYHIFFWEESSGGFQSVTPWDWPMPWLKDHCEDATHFTISYNFMHKRWEYLLYKLNEENRFIPQFVKCHPRMFYSLNKVDAQSANAKHGENTELFKLQKSGYMNGTTAR